MRSVLGAILLSILLHTLFISGTLWTASLFENAKPPTEVAEIQLIEAPRAPAPKKPEQSIVRQAIVPEKMRIKEQEDETLARFLSEQRQRVKQESQAALNGMTENRANTISRQQPKAAEPPRERTPHEDSQPDKDGYRSVDISKELQDMNRLNQGLSSVGESLPTDVKVGSFTALNTDRYLYYTFYARIEELVRYRWETRVYSAIDSFDRATLMSASNKNWITSVEFLLDRTGALKSAIIMKESGIRKFDMAAVEAFKDARIFPNPPQEMVQEDGFIHLKFSFNVNYRAPAVVNR
ncbi:Gram-negative bacterial tonB protein [compost metagenome]